MGKSGYESFHQQKIHVPYSPLWRSARLVKPAIMKSHKHPSIRKEGSLHVVSNTLDILDILDADFFSEAHLDIPTSSGDS